MNIADEIPSLKDLAVYLQDDRMCWAGEPREEIKPGEELLGTLSDGLRDVYGVVLSLEKRIAFHRRLLRGLETGDEDADTITVENRPAFDQILHFRIEIEIDTCMLNATKNLFWASLKKKYKAHAVKRFHLRKNWAITVSTASRILAHPCEK